VSPEIMLILCVSILRACCPETELLTAPPHGSSSRLLLTAPPHGSSSRLLLTAPPHGSSSLPQTLFCPCPALLRKRCGPRARWVFSRVTRVCLKHMFGELWACMCSIVWQAAQDAACRDGETERRRDGETRDGETERLETRD
jgi:hypothetical protein